MYCSPADQPRDRSGQVSGIAGGGGGGEAKRITSRHGQAGEKHRLCCKCLFPAYHLLVSFALCCDLFG